LLLPAATPAAGQAHRPDEVTDVAVQQVFERGISDYVALRRRLAPSLPPLRVSGAEELTHAVDALADAIRTARAGAKAGDIFCAGVAVSFRLLIDRTLATGGSTLNDLLAEGDDEASLGIGPVVVNGRFPHGRGAAMWPEFLSALPPLPAELQYRFVDRDLVLIDIDSGLVVDVLSEALPPAPRRSNVGSKRQRSGR
jgi:hypothetical protein